jgi:hypothetical protein
MDRSADRRHRGGGLATVLAVGCLATGGGLLWGDAQKDADGYFSTAREPFATSTHALTTDNLDVDLDGAGWIIGRDEFGKVRIEVQPRAGKPVFVGIAPTNDVSAYLTGTAHTSITEVSYSPFRAESRDRSGDGRPARPADQRFWAASAHGAGTQTVTWDLEDGDWSVVVMNADASRIIDTTISAGAKVPFLATAGWVSIGAGVLLLTVAGALFVRVARRPRNRSTAAGQPAVLATA